MNDPLFTQTSAERPLREVLARENQFLKKKLRSSYQDYGGQPATASGESLNPPASGKYPANIAELLAQACVIILSRSRMASIKDRGVPPVSSPPLPSTFPKESP